MTTAARSIASATIGFGLISIPVKVYSTSETAKDISFHIHHDKDGGRLEQKLSCTTCGELVDKDHVVKGYEHAKGQHVLFTEAEMDTLLSPATQQIEIDAFVPQEEVDGIFIEKSYFLGPDKGADKPYQLLADALIGTGRVAIGRYATRGKEYVVAVRTFEDGLMFHQLRYQSEVKPWEAIPAREPVNISKAEVALARELVRRMSASDLDMSKYTDRVKERAAALIAAKVASGEIIQAPTATHPEALAAPPFSLSELIRASLDVAPAKSPKPAPRGTPKRKRAA